MQARGPEGPAELLDTRKWFGRSAPVVLEIGSGTGTSTLAMAKAEPHIDVVAVEVYRRGLAQLLSAIAREGVTNIRLVRGDGVDVIEHMFGPDSLTGVRVFFPDPWPKKRHHKRRLVQPPFMGDIARVLKDGGLFHLATDWDDYNVHSRTILDANRDFAPASGIDLCDTPLGFRPPTKFERRGLRLGHDVVDLYYKRTCR